METAQTDNSAACGQSRSTVGLAIGRAAHEEWERALDGENECDAEKRLSAEAFEQNNILPAGWWDGWFERSDEWRDEIGHDG